MNIKDAFQIVYELAEQNVLSEDLADKFDLQEERQRQLTAINTFHDFVVNEYCD